VVGRTLCVNFAENCIIQRFYITEISISFVYIYIYLNEIGGACGAYVGGERGVQGSGGET